MNIKTQVDQLNDMILKGNIMEAMNTFYADDVVMAENDHPATNGLEANLTREQDFVDNTTWFGLKLLRVAVGPDISMVQWFMDFDNKAYGKRLAFTQVAVQKWRDGKIYDERFYYNPVEVNQEP